jgi:hypothetical protein
VVKQLAKTNKNLNVIEHGTKEVEKVANLWQNTYRNEDQHRNRSTK